MKLTKDEVSKMQADRACPCCGKGLSALEIRHLAGDGATSTSESFRRTGLPDGIELPGGGVLNLREAAITVREAAEQRDFEESVRVFESMGMSRRGAEAAARGRDGDGRY